jgi:nicotinamide-nucleotide amidase
MTVEIVIIGDELLSGSRLDTNSAYLAQRLDGIGLDIRYKTTTGDNMDQLVEALTLALRRANIVITTGGLGPTDDDITKKAICKVFKRNLIFHEEVLEDLKKRFAARGIKMPSINQNQALLPQGARFLANRFGSALGIVIEEQGKFLCAMPGVPNEMQAMTDEELVPLLQLRPTIGVTIRHQLRTTGIMESALAEIIRPILKIPEGATLSYLPSYRGVDLCIKAAGAVEEDVRSTVRAIADAIREAVREYIYTEDNRELEEIVGRLLIERHKTLATAESCTGGLLGGRITRVSGSSQYYLGGVVAYADEVKTARLGVPRELIDRHGAVAAETAQAMADGVRLMLKADIGIGVTGIAGPTGATEGKPVGTVFIGLATAKGVSARQFSLGFDRESVRERAVTAALEMVRRELLKNA